MLVPTCAGCNARWKSRQKRKTALAHITTGAGSGGAMRKAGMELASLGGPSSSSQEPPAAGAGVMTRKRRAGAGSGWQAQEELEEELEEAESGSSESESDESS